MRRPFLATCLALFLSLLAACGGPEKAPFHGTDISGATFGKDFRLNDAAGKPKSLADFRGKVVTLFFGYTQCPDVCPTNLSAMAAVMKKLGPEADKVQVLFVTVDPERDTPELLTAYVPAFDPRFLALMGDAAATAATAKEFKIFYQKQKGGTPDTYTMDHSAGTYVFDPQGRLRLLEKHGETVDNLAADLRLLLAGK